MGIRRMSAHPTLSPAGTGNRRASPQGGLTLPGTRKTADAIRIAPFLGSFVDDYCC